MSKFANILGRLRNEVFQFVWFIVRGMIPRKIGDGTQLVHYAPRMIAQLILAWLFFGPSGVLLGDSNSEVFSRYRVMRRFNRLFVSLGVGGTRVDQWVEFFRYTWQGKVVLFLIGKAHRVVNLGGNNVLQRKLARIALDLGQLHVDLSKGRIIFVKIPPIYFDVFEANGWPPTLREEVLAVNNMLDREFQTIIDPALLVDLGKLQDLIHYSTNVVYKLQDLIHYSTNVVYKLQDLIQSELGIL